MARRFKIQDTITRRYSRFSEVETQLASRLLPTHNARDHVSHFLASVNDLIDHALQNLSVGDMVGITIQNRVNQNDKLIGISFRRKDQLAGDVIWTLVEMVSK